MCGIVGAIVISKNGRMMKPEFVEEGLLETALRGTDATGFWSPETGLVKDGKDAKDFIKKYDKEILALEKSKVWIGHCRAATRGKHADAPPTNNENNHPFETDRWVLVHNGVLTDSPEVKDYQYKGACDSEVAISYLQKFGPAGFKYIMGIDSASLVAYDKQENLLYFWRNKNPLVWSISVDQGLLMFGSTVGILDAMCDLKSIAGFNIHTRMVAYSSNEHELSVIAPGKGLVKTEKIEPMLMYKLRASDEAKEFVLPEERYTNTRYDGAPYGWDRRREQSVVTTKRNPYAIGGGTIAPIICFSSVVDYKVVWSGRMYPGSCLGTKGTIGEFMEVDRLFDKHPPLNLVFPS